MRLQVMTCCMDWSCLHEHLTRCVQVREHPNKRVLSSPEKDDYSDQEAAVAGPLWKLRQCLSFSI